MALFGRLCSMSRRDSHVGASRPARSISHDRHVRVPARPVTQSLVPAPQFCREQMIVGQTWYWRAYGYVPESEATWGIECDERVCHADKPRAFRMKQNSAMDDVS
jgi:hypothetical protein